MGRIGLAFRIFFDVLFRADAAEQVRQLKTLPPPVEAPTPAPVSKPAPPPAPKPPARSDALTLLETLQREARFLDFIQEEITPYSNEQVGGAVRDVHRGCQAVFKRLFQLGPAIDVAEGSPVTLSGNESAAQYRLVGNVTDRRPVTGVVVHPGWKAERCDLPVWTGAADSQQLLAPAEVEIPR